MHEAIEKRALIVLDGLGTRIQGTFHRPADHLAHRNSSHGRNGRPGVLFFNSLSLPRAASGDSAVYWADSIAESGYPAFRIDLPGLGDSQGNSSTDLLDNINAGGFASVAAAIVKELVDRFSLSGLVIFGHCAGAVSALYASGASSECRGLVLLDPYFHLPQAKRHRVREEISEWVRRNKAGRLASDLYDRVRNLFLKVRGQALPGNANIELLNRWKQVSGTGLPILMLQAPGIKAQGAKPRVGQFDFIEHVVKLAGRKSRVAVEFVEGADHSFANRDGRAAVLKHIEGWMVAHFPLEDFTRTAENAAAVRANDSRKSSTAPTGMGCVLEGR